MLFLLTFSLYFLIGITIIFVSFYLFVTLWKFKHWKRRGLKYVKPEFPYGTFRYGAKEHVTETLLRHHVLFKDVPEGIYGTFHFFVPTITVTSLDLVKQIFVKDFVAFRDRFTNYIVKNDYLTRNLVRLEGDEWKILRQKLTPAFSSGKMKSMVKSMVLVAEKAVALLEKEIQMASSDHLEVKDFAARYTTDVIALSVFGLECNCLEDEEAEFKKMGERILQVNRPKSFLMSRFPFLASLFRMQLFDKRAREYFTKVVKGTVKYREKNTVNRGDFIDMLLRIRSDEENDLQKLTLEEITAQLVLFYTAGFDNTSSAITFTLMEMSLNEGIQNRARASVMNSLSKHKNEPYEALSDMQFLDQCINETFRKYPPSPVINRSATKDYQIPGTEFLIEKGTRITVPIHAFHHDPEYFSNPETYDPDRFTSGIQHHKAFMPFGDGPRSCIAARFGTLAIKVLLVSLLKNFQFNPIEKEGPDTLEFNNKMPMFHIKSGLYLNWQKINN